MDPSAISTTLLRDPAITDEPDTGRTPPPFADVAASLPTPAD
jgi:hypothetical protein